MPNNLAQLSVPPLQPVIVASQTVTSLIGTDHAQLTEHVVSATARMAAVKAELDAEFERMQAESARQGWRVAFDATPEQLGAAAVAAATKLV